MKKHTFSLLYLLVLLVTLPFHVQLKNLLVSIRGFNFINYVLLGILAAFFAMAFFKALKSGKTHEIAALLLAAAVIIYFLFQRRIFLNKVFFANFLHIAEFFLLGILLSRESKKGPSLIPFIILFASAFAFELLQIFFHNRVVDSNDIWTNVISGLVGQVVGFF